MFVFICWGLFLTDQAQSIQVSSHIEFLKEVSIEEKSTIRKTLKAWLFGKNPRMFRPFGIALGKEDRIALADTQQGVVIIANKRGQIIKKIKAYNRNRLVSPVGLVFDTSGHLFVSDSSWNTILEYSEKYHFIKRFEAPEGGRMTGISTFGNRVFALDTTNHRLILFSMNGSILKTLGGRGSAKGQFNFPTHLTSDENYIYITDAMNFRIVVLDHDGQWVHSFGSNGSSGGHFSKPKGIAVDQDGHILVADAMFDNIQVFNIKGEFLSVFGSSGNGPGEMWMPSGIDVGLDGLIWVADTYNQRLQIFEIVKGKK